MQITTLMSDPCWHIREICYKDKLFQVFNPLFNFTINEANPAARRTPLSVAENFFMDRYRARAIILTEEYGRRRTVEAFQRFREFLKRQDFPSTMEGLRDEFESFPQGLQDDYSLDLEEERELPDYSNMPGPHFRARFIGRKRSRDIYQLKLVYEDVEFYRNIPKDTLYDVTKLISQIPENDRFSILIKELYEGVKREENWHNVDVRLPKLARIRAYTLQ